jgi:hypothetical protein
LAQSVVLTAGSTLYDGELGWYWMTTRSYDPTLERHPCAGTRQPDPSQSEGIFTYAYAGDNLSETPTPAGWWRRRRKPAAW